MKSLVWISGASSGIGAALARAVPYPDARTIDVSRSGGGPAPEHLAADLSNPHGWDVLAASFAAELDGFRGERVVFFHNAGTIDPVGFAGEVDPGAYRRNVLLNSASPQVLGQAFLAATRRTHARASLVITTSGAAQRAYEGWSGYCAGKAAVDAWVRRAGAQEQALANGVQVLAIAPGTVDTAMQAQIRAASADAFPNREKFVGLYEQRQLADPDDVAVRMWGLLDREDLPSGSVLDLRAL